MKRRTLLSGTAALLAGMPVAWRTARADQAAADEHCEDGCCQDCQACRAACLRCAAACLDEEERKACILACLDCADICGTCSAIAARGGPMSSATRLLCAEACERCAAECEKHKDDEACQACAKSCRACAAQCRAAGKSA